MSNGVCPPPKNYSYFGTSTRKGSDIVVTSFFCTKAGENDKQFMFPNWVDWYPWSLSDVVLLHCDDWMFPNVVLQCIPWYLCWFQCICIHFHITERKIDYLHCWRVTLSVWSSCQLYCFPTTDKPFIFPIQRAKSPRPHKMWQL